MDGEDFLFFSRGYNNKQSCTMSVTNTEDFGLLGKNGGAPIPAGLLRPSVEVCVLKHKNACPRRSSKTLQGPRMPWNVFEGLAAS